MKKIIFSIIALIAAASMVGCETSKISDSDSSLPASENELKGYIDSTIESTAERDEDEENKMNYFIKLDTAKFQNHLILASLYTQSGGTVPHIVFNDNAEPVFKSEYSIIQTGDYFEILDLDESRGIYKSKYFLADNHGNVLFGVDFSDGWDESFVYLDSGDGYLATLHENSNFSDVDYRASIYGPKGELIKEFSFSDRINGKYYGSGVFRFAVNLDSDYFAFFYNVETDSIFYGEINNEFVGGKSLKFDESDYLIGYYNTDGTFNELDSPINLQPISGGNESHIIENCYMLCDDIGVTQDSKTEKYYLFNLENQKLYSLDEITNKLYPSSMYKIYEKDGYVQFPVKGADEGLYTAIYDYEGNCVLKPENSLKDYVLQSIVDDKAFFTNVISNTEEDIQVYDLKNHKFIDASIYGKIIPLSDFSNDIAIAQTHYYVNSEKWFYTFIDRSYSPILEHENISSTGEYLPYMEINADNVKDAGPLDTNLVWSPNEDVVNIPELVKSHKQNNSNIERAAQETHNDSQLNITGGETYSNNNEFYSDCDMKGQINCHGGTVSGFTTDYVVNGGAVQKVRNSLGDTWHVTAKNTCNNYGVTWYELWDTDDGDYYGWVDSDYIDFY